MAALVERGSPCYRGQAFKGVSNKGIVIKLSGAPCGRVLICCLRCGG